MSVQEMELGCPTKAAVAWRGKILRCMIETATPILFPTLDVERWVDQHVVCRQIPAGEYVFCVKDTQDGFHVLYDEEVWETKRKYFKLCVEAE